MFMLLASERRSNRPLDRCVTCDAPHVKLWPASLCRSVLACIMHTCVHCSVACFSCATNQARNMKAEDYHRVEALKEGAFYIFAHPPVIIAQLSSALAIKLTTPMGHFFGRCITGPGYTTPQIRSISM